MGKAYRDKWKKFKILKKSTYLSSKLPETKTMNKENLWKMIGRHKKVILKPKQGEGGKGVIQVISEGNDQYDIHTGNTQKQKLGKKQTYRYIKNRMKSRSYMVQKRISLAKANGRPFDLRVTVQRKKRNSPWRITGKLAKVAGKGYIITNIKRSRGKVIPVKSAIHQSSLRKFSTSKLLSKIDKVAKKSAKQLAKKFPWLRTVGMDMALDKKGKVWIIEANFAPDHSLFLKLKDKSMYRTIMSYEKK